MSLLSAAAADEDGDEINALRTANERLCHTLRAMNTTLDATKKSAAHHAQAAERLRETVIRWATRAEEAENMLEAIGAGGVGPLMKRKPSVEEVIQMTKDAAVLGNIESLFNACMHQEYCKRWKAQAEQQQGLDHQHKSSRDSDLQHETGQLITGRSSAPAGWKLVPVEPTEDMLSCIRDHVRDYPRWWEHSYRDLIKAAPQPPTTEQSSAVEQQQSDQDGLRASNEYLLGCMRDWSELAIRLRTRVAELESQVAAPSVVEQPQGEQEPVAVIGDGWTLLWVGCGPIAHIVKKHGLRIGDKLYTHPQPKREPLTDEQVPNGVLSAISLAGMTLLKTQHGYELKKLGPTVAHGIGQEAASPQPTSEDCSGVEQKPSAIIAFEEGKREPRLVAWNQLPIGQHCLYKRPTLQAADHDAQEQCRTALQAIEKLNAELGRVSEQRDKLLVALKSLANFDSYETEYDGRMYSICPSCGCQDSEEHRGNCDFLVARAAIDSVEGGTV